MNKQCVEFNRDEFCKTYALGDLMPLFVNLQNAHLVNIPMVIISLEYFEHLQNTEDECRDLANKLSLAESQVDDLENEVVT